MLADLERASIVTHNEIKGFLKHAFWIKAGNGARGDRAIWAPLFTPERMFVLLAAFMGVQVASTNSIPDDVKVQQYCSPLNLSFLD